LIFCYRDSDKRVCNIAYVILVTLTIWDFLLVCSRDLVVTLHISCVRRKDQRRQKLILRLSFFILHDMNPPVYYGSNPCCRGPTSLLQHTKRTIATVRFCLASKGMTSEVRSAILDGRGFWPKRAARVKTCHIWFRSRIGKRESRL
jgi:hypothetical protein